MQEEGGIVVGDFRWWQWGGLRVYRVCAVCLCVCRKLEDRERERDEERVRERE